jgi:hypothetical protein
MSEVVITDADAGASALKRAIARHPWWWFFLVALVPTALVAAGGSWSVSIFVITDGFAVLGALLVAWASDAAPKVTGRTGARIAVFLVTLIAFLAVTGWVYGAWVLALPTAVFTAVALSGAWSPTISLRDLVRPLLRLHASTAAWLVALLAWPLLGALTIAASHIGAPANVHGESFLPASIIPWGFLVALPTAIGWYGFAARRLLRRTSAVNTALLVGLLPWIAVFAPRSIWSTPLVGDYGLRTSLDAFAFAIVALWVYQRSRDSLLPVFVLLAETAIVAWAVFAWSAPRIWGSDRQDLIAVGLHSAFALVLLLQGRMWRRPTMGSDAEARGA